MKTYQFAGKTVKAVPETNVCVGCAFNAATYICEMDNYEKDRPHDIVQRENNMPVCYEEEIIFKIVTDENI